jgi:outer membrane protein TolC
LEVTTIYEQMEDAHRRERAWAGGEKETRAWFIAAVQGYQIGTLESRDLVDAVRAYFNARFSHIQAIRDLNTATAELERVSGLGPSEASAWEPDCR